MNYVNNANSLNTYELEEGYFRQSSDRKLSDVIQSLTLLIKQDADETYDLSKGGFSASLATSLVRAACDPVSLILQVRFLANT